MTIETWTMWNPPPDPERDLWWAAQRIAAPDVVDFEQRHQRGMIRIPYDIVAGRAGELVAAWVCCDQACGGVAISADGLNLDHGCCAWRGRPGPYERQHKTGLGTTYFTGYHHGPFTAWWEPGEAS